MTMFRYSIVYSVGIALLQQQQQYATIEAFVGVGKVPVAFRPSPKQQSQPFSFSIHSSSTTTTEEPETGRNRKKREFDDIPLVKVGDVVPNMDVELVKPKSDGTLESSATGIIDLLGASGTSIVVGMPGAFTPTCTKTHFPGFLKAAREFANMGVDNIAVVTTNDKYVYNAWAASMGITEDAEREEGTPEITMIADGDGDFVKTLGLAEDMGFGIGTRAKRFAMVITDGKVKYVATDPGMDTCTQTSAEAIIAVMRETLNEKVMAAAEGDETNIGLILAAGVCLALAAFSSDGLLDSLPF